MSNNAAEREIRRVAVGRHNWTFAGSDEGGRRAATIYTLINTAKLNGIDPQGWLADVLARLPDYPMRRIARFSHGAGKRRPTPPLPEIGSSRKPRRSVVFTGCVLDCWAWQL